MGLDWVILAKEVNRIEINPTEVIGAKRATRDDPLVVNELRLIWQDSDQAMTFDEFLTEVTSREIPPVVIPFGEGFQDAIPAVQAEVQYYGYRGKAIEPEFNCISEFAEQNGQDMSWIYGEMVAQSDIEEKINLLEGIFNRYKSIYPEIATAGEQYFLAWHQQRSVELDQIEQDLTNDIDKEKIVFEIFGFLGAIEWLRFWSDKGFKIVADF